jgi:8-oxo-dGTP pyrophosphatase MutT (NUDIX family)
MSYLDHIRACNRHDLSGFIPFSIDGAVVGWVRPAFARSLEPWEGLFSLKPDRLEMTLPPGELEQRSRPLAEMLETLVTQGILSHLHGEQYVATPAGREQGLVFIDRAAATRFGIRAFGQHLNGFVRSRDGLKLWVGRRSTDRINFPGQLDHLVAGGLPWGIGMQENLVKECREEAGIPEPLARRAVPVGAVTYVSETGQGLKPDTLYCYDLELPEDFQPHCIDGEVAGFHLWPLEQVMETVRGSDEFKLNCNLVIIDFLIRHGCLGPGREDYLELVTGLHPPLP